MLLKIIQALVIIWCLVMFFYYYFIDGTVKDLVFWGIFLLFNYIGRCTEIIIEE